MPALPPYLPNRDAALANWAANFSSLITAAPASYGLTATDAVNISTVQSAFAAAYTLVTSGTTKTAATVSAKNVAKTNMLAVVRPYAQAISLNVGVSSANKIALGLNPRTSTPSPISAPASNPVLSFQSASNLAAVIRYRDSASAPSVKGKPYGVKICGVRYAVSASPITDPTQLTQVVNATKSPFVVQFSPADAGKQAYMAAQWLTATGKASPWSPVISVTVVAAG